MAMIWTPSTFADEGLARELAHRLGVAGELAGPFDAALGSWLSEFSEHMEARDRARLPGLGSTKADGILRETATCLADTSAGQVYAWSRLSKAQDGLWAFAFGNAVTGPMLREHIAALQPTSLSSPELVALVDYLKDVADSPNSTLIQDMWLLAAPLLGADDDARQAILLWILNLVQRRSFHHSLRDLVRVLREVRGGDARVINTLRRFSPRNGQGATLVAGEVIRTCSRRQEWPREAAAVIDWLLDAKAKDPTGRWKKRREELMESIGPDVLQTVSRFIRKHPDWARHEPTGWRDEMFWFMWKSASWHEGKIPSPLLGRPSSRR